MKSSETHRKGDMLWHGGKALLCALQFWILTHVTESDFLPFLKANMEDKSSLMVLLQLLYPVIVTILFFVLWCYYDNIDDRSFHKVCQSPEPPQFLRDPAYLLASR